jgi:hypothetical protein
VPADATITSGQNTKMIDVQWGITPGTVSVIAGNFCGTSNPSVLAVSLMEVPPVPDTITGPPLVCINANIDFSTEEIAGAISYLWTVFPDGIIMSGQGSKTINVNWGANPGTVNVLAQNSCGSGPQKTKEIGLETIPSAAGMITGKDTVCKNHTGYLYRVEEISGAISYTWAVPAGAKISGVEDENEILVDFTLDAVSGEISVSGHNTCGNGMESTKSVIVSPCTGIRENKQVETASIYPNPSADLINVEINDQLKQIKMIMTDINGHEVYTNSLQNTQPGFIVKIDVSAFARGLYFIRLISDDQLFTEKVVIQ